MGARVVTGKSVQRPQSGGSPQRQGGSEFGETGQERAWRLEPDGPGGPGGDPAFPQGVWCPLGRGGPGLPPRRLVPTGEGGTRPSPKASGAHWGGAVRERHAIVTTCLPQPWHCQSPGQPQGHGVRPSCRGQCSDGGVSCEVRGGSQSGRPVRRTRSPGRGWRGVSGRSSLSKSVEFGRYRKNVRHGQ